MAGMAAKPVWYPSPAYVQGSHLERLMAALGVPNYDALYRESVEHRDHFWQKTLELIGIEWIEPYRQFVDLSRGPEWPEWFVGGRMNLAHNAVTRHAKGSQASAKALVWEGEDGATVSLSFGALERGAQRRKLPALQSSRPCGANAG